MEFLSISIPPSHQCLFLFILFVYLYFCDLLLCMKEQLNNLKS